MRTGLPSRFARTRLSLRCCGHRRWLLLFLAPKDLRGRPRLLKNCHKHLRRVPPNQILRQVWLWPAWPSVTNPMACKSAVTTTAIYLWRLASLSASKGMETSRTVVHLSSNGRTRSAARKVRCQTGSARREYLGCTEMHPYGTCAGLLS